MMKTRSLRPSPDQIAVARRFVRDSIVELGGTIGERHGGDVELITSEAVANAVEHAGTLIELTVRRTDVGFLVSIHDESSAPIASPELPSATSSSHRGVGIIDALADRWGVENIEGDGKTLWFLVETGATAPAS